MTANVISESILVIYEWVRLFFHADLYPYFGTLLHTFIIAAICGISGAMAATIAETKGHGVMLHFFAGLLLPYAYPIIIIFVLKEKFGENAVDGNLDHSVARVDVASFEITEKIKQHRIEKQLAKLGIDEASEDAQAILKQEDKLFEKHTAGLTPPALDAQAEATDQADTATADQDNVATTALRDVGITDTADSPPIMNKKYFDALAVNELGERNGPFNLELKNAQIIVAEMIVGTLDELAIFEIVDHNGQSKRIRIRYDNIVACTKRSV